MPKEISSTDLQVKLIMQQFRENLRKCALNGFNCPNIPPSENTDNKELVPATDSGVVDSVGDALFTDSELEILFILVNTEIDLDDTEETIFPLHQLKSIQKKLLSLGKVGAK